MRALRIHLTPIQDPSKHLNRPCRRQKHHRNRVLCKAHLQLAKQALAAAAPITTSQIGYWQCKQVSPAAGLANARCRLHLLSDAHTFTRPSKLYTNLQLAERVLAAAARRRRVRLAAHAAQAAAAASAAAGRGAAPVVPVLLARVRAAQGMNGLVRKRPGQRFGSGPVAPALLAGVRAVGWEGMRGNEQLSQQNNSGMPLLVRKPATAPVLQHRRWLPRFPIHSALVHLAANERPRGIILFPQLLKLKRAKLMLINRR